MISMFKKSLLIVCFMFTSFILVSARTVSEFRTQLREYAQILVDNNIQNPKINSFLISGSSLSEEDLIDLCDQMLTYRKGLGEQALEVANIKDELIKYLRSFIASGMDFGEFDPNFALFYDEQNPDFIVEFVNPAGEIKTRKYALKIWSIGLKFEFAVKIVGISIVGNNFNYYDTNKRFNLGSGIDLAFMPSLLALLPIPAGCSVVFAGINGTSCKILMLGIDLGFVGSLSYVYGGTMTPIKE